MKHFLGIFTSALLFIQCNPCEEKGTITFDNTARYWCNCEVQFSNGDVYVIYHGEERTYEFWRGRYNFTVYCGNGAYDNDNCGAEEGTREFSVEIDCGDSHYINTKF